MTIYMSSPFVKALDPALDRQDETRHRPAFLGLPQLTLPQSGRRMVLYHMRIRLHRLQIGDEDSGVEILTQLADSLVLNRPYVHPIQPWRGALPFHKNLVSDAADANRLKRKGVTGGNTSK